MLSRGPVVLLGHLALFCGLLAITTQPWATCPLAADGSGFERCNVKQITGRDLQFVEEGNVHGMLLRLSENTYARFQQDDVVVGLFSSSPSGSFCGTQQFCGSVNITRVLVVASLLIGYGAVLLSFCDNMVITSVALVLAAVCGLAGVSMWEDVLQHVDFEAYVHGSAHSWMAMSWLLFTFTAVLLWFVESAESVSVELETQEDFVMEVSDALKPKNGKPKGLQGKTAWIQESAAATWKAVASRAASFDHQQFVQSVCAHPLLANGPRLTAIVCSCIAALLGLASFEVSSDESSSPCFPTIVARRTIFVSVVLGLVGTALLYATKRKPIVLLAIAALGSLCSAMFWIIGLRSSLYWKPDLDCYTEHHFSVPVFMCMLCGSLYSCAASLTLFA